MHEPTHFVAEQYLPSARSGEFAATCGVWEGNDEGAKRLYVVHMPEDEVCLYLFEARSRDAVIEAGRQAGTPFDRVSTARLVHSQPTSRRRTS
jgi:hypothetical protein